ncbi:hypothetical protein ABIG06_001035 [Bradyrhizobium sp. USDA 326]
MWGKAVALPRYQFPAKQLMIFQNIACTRLDGSGLRYAGPIALMPAAGGRRRARCIDRQRWRRAMGMSDQLELVALHRSGGGSPPKQERYTFDFVVNGQSLFAVTGASNFDLSGCLSVPQREPELAVRLNDGLARLLTLAVPIGGSNRMALYVCSECGGLACGAITALVSRSDASCVGPTLRMRMDIAAKSNCRRSVPLRSTGHPT